MDISFTVAGQVLSISIISTVIGTIWFARRNELHNPAYSILVIFAWLIPIIGPACLLTVLASRSRAAEIGRHSTRNKAIIDLT